jgi:hypothetical protein
VRLVDASDGRVGLSLPLEQQIHRAYSAEMDTGQSDVSNRGPQGTGHRAVEHGLQFVRDTVSRLSGKLHKARAPP